MTLATLLAASAATPPAAQEAAIELGGIRANPDAPVEITADRLDVDRPGGTAVFAGNVVVGQGDLRLAAERVEVVYDEGSGEIARLLASGGVTFVTPTEQAEAQEADYDIEGGEIVLTGDVLLTQGASAVAADRMVANVDAGTAVMTGRVRTVFSRDGE